MSNSSQDKSQLRATLLEERRRLDPQTREASSEAVRRTLADEPRLLDADHLAGYVAFDGEVDLMALLRERIEAGLRISLPRVEDDDRMHYVPVDDLDDLREGAFGIPEPTGQRGDLASLDVFLVPGVGFDPSGGRLGMGWGYYDRILSRRLKLDAPRPLLVGVCHDCQLVDRVPTEPHDVTMDVVVTNQTLIDITHETSTQDVDER